ncbi:MAG: hypothetical protein J6Y94_05670 [Bacteriovoracaceae bacterium]|nr:hypothetical protein [Bacteriovoracaceae bacterium]
MDDKSSSNSSPPSSPSSSPSTNPQPSTLAQDASSPSSSPPPSSSSFLEQIIWTIFKAIIVLGITAIAIIMILMGVCFWSIGK